MREERRKKANNTDFQRLNFQMRVVFLQVSLSPSLRCDLGITCDEMFFGIGILRSEEVFRYRKCGKINCKEHQGFSKDTEKEAKASWNSKSV